MKPKLAGVLGTAQFRPAEPEEIFAALGAHPGSLGAVGVTGYPVYADERLRGAMGMTTGANEDGFHLRHVAIGRDMQVTRWADLRLVQAGEACPTVRQTAEGPASHRGRPCFQARHQVQPGA